MSLARQHREKVLARLASASTVLAGEDGQPAADKPRRPPLIAREEPERRSDRPARLTVAALHKAKVAAALAVAAANDNAAEPSDEMLAGPYGQMLLQLTEHKRALKALQSNEGKADLKRQILPVYADWVDGVLAAARETDQAVQDDVVMTVMVWRIDAGDFMGALEIADHAIHFGLALPAHFNRTLPCLVAEEIADAALAAPIDAPIPHGVLDLTAQLVEGRDMPDQVRAKLAKAQALEMVRLADNPPEDHAIAGWKSTHLAEALDLFRRALQLNPKVGVKKDIERLEAVLRKEAPDAP